MREVLNAIIRREVAFVSEEAIVHFQDLYDRLLRVIDLIEHELVSRFFDVLETRIERIARMLIVRLEQERLRLASACIAILSPNKRVRPV